ncbi:hypothetical protein [Oceanobacillus massiliensis]|uniref:hypothetical protein n=1 Tax=Oceanobacillus massiliensis TaxID=1465765 RepID=UPI0030184B0F
MVKVFNPILNFLSGKVGIIDKVFGNLIYDKKISEYKVDYRIKDLKETIVDTELERKKL